MKNLLQAVTVVAIAVFLSAATFADVRVKSRQTIGGQSYETTTLIKGKRQRVESMNGISVSLTQCDLRRMVQLNPAAKLYTVSAFAEANTASTDVKPGTPAKATKTETEKGGVVTTIVDTKDTGERKQMFGYTARRLIITMEMKSSPDACNKTNMKMVTDGWYIDTEFAFNCDYGYAGQYYNPGTSSGCRDRYQTKATGTGKRGYPVYEKVTMFDESGRETQGMITEVLEISRAVLAANLFEIPSDYTEAIGASSMYAAAAAAAGASSKDDSSSITKNAVQTTEASQTTLGEKKPGVIRIGLPVVKTGAVGDGISAADLAAAVRHSFSSYLKAPNVEIVLLEARLPDAISAEAASKQCDFLVNASTSHKKGGGGFGGMLGQALGSAISTGAGIAGGVAGHVAASTVITATTVASQVKAKDEITLDVGLQKVGGASLLTKSYKAKAKSSGEDIISQVVEKAAIEISQLAL